MRISDWSSDVCSSDLVLTNGCGGLRDTWSPGTPVLISDHINLTATSPIEGANFVDLTDLYSARLRAMCREVEPSLDQGVYVQFPGSPYATPAATGTVRATAAHPATAEERAVGE